MNGNPAAKFSSQRTFPKNIKQPPFTAPVDWIGLTGEHRHQPRCWLNIMNSMKFSTPQGRATYAAYRFCLAIDRVLNAASSAEKMRANAWANAWSTAYFARTDRRSASNSENYYSQVERRRRGRSSTSR